MPGRVVRADDAHRALDERRLEELEGEAGRLAAALAVAETEYEAYYAEAVELRGLVAGGAAEIGRLTTALALATARYRAAEEMLIDNMPADWLVRATGHHTFDALWATDSDFVESMRLEARARLDGEA